VNNKHDSLLFNEIMFRLVIQVFGHDYFMFLSYDIFPTILKMMNCNDWFHFFSSIDWLIKVNLQTRFNNYDINCEARFLKCFKYIIIVTTN